MALASAVVLLVSGVASAATCAIDDGAKYTDGQYVMISYTPGPSSTEYRISNMSFFPPTASTVWLPVTLSRRFFWSMGYDGINDGTSSVYMEFRDSPSDTSYDSCHASIVMDTHNPMVWAYPVTVERGHVCRLKFRSFDATSPKCKATLTIKTKSGATKKKFVDNFQKVSSSPRWWLYRCRLRKGTYRITVSCEDLAGNINAQGRGAWLHVK
jgi:hypothetical protein